MTSGRSNLWTSDIQSFLSAVLTTAAFKGILLGAIIALTWHYFILSERSRDGIRMKLFLAILMFMIMYVNYHFLSFYY